ncbi:MAG: bifunctional 23S rRNA (guanine(2069)-N(7))-methyltransferase RlmK/23S rRNA (guanine(2445)-N(2))-methyltransferase RlmL [Planctomycetota bacterium]
MPQPLKLTASCAFGLEGIVKRELGWLGYDATVHSPGRVDFEGQGDAIARANVWLRAASRVGVIVADGNARDFDELFGLVRSVRWRELLREDARVTTRVRLHDATISSAKSAQGVVKRGVVHAMVGPGQQMPETGTELTVEAAVQGDHAMIILDTSGDGLHRRGYRERSFPGQLKETLAAGIVMTTGWRGDRPLIDPFCGGGTIVIEAAMIAAHIAPGRNRRFVGESLPWIPQDEWDCARDSGSPEEVPTTLPQIMGRDTDSRAIGMARRCAEAAGVTGLVGFRVGDFRKLARPSERGWVITNPPYGSRVLDESAARAIHEALPETLAAMPRWSHAIFTGLPDFECTIRQRATKRRKLYNGRLRCDLFMFTPSRTDSGGASFGDTSSRDGVAEAFANTLRKRIRHMRKWPARGIECYRLYDGQTPGARLHVDLYRDRLHIAELESDGRDSLGDEAAWRSRLEKIARDATGIAPDKTYVKLRRRQRGNDQYQRTDEEPANLQVREHDLRFEVELATRLDTGLFLDHRPARQLIRGWSGGLRVLNLFCYTGAFTVAAAAGGAAGSISVDLSTPYLDWTLRNLKLNDIDTRRHALIAADAMGWLEDGAEGRRFDLIIADPPTFSNSKRTSTVFDVQRDHTDLLQLCKRCLMPDGRIFFSTNCRGFKLDPAVCGREITSKTVPEDFPRSRPHRSWLLDNSSLP